jgi:hypothetical protein
MTKSELLSALDDLARAQSILEEGRDGASPEWLDAALSLVNRCRMAYDRARRDSEESSESTGEAWRGADSWQQDQYFVGRRPN